MALISTNISRPSYLSLSIAMLVSLILLLCLSLKIIIIQGLSFTASSILIAMTSAFYLTILKKCSFTEQRQILNQALLALYLFSLGIYFLLHLSVLESSYENSAYQIIFDNIPRKFFAATLAFSLGFYLPHLVFCNQNANSLPYAKSLALSILGGFIFLTIDYFILFYTDEFIAVDDIYWGSLFVATLVFILVRLTYQGFNSLKKLQRPKIEVSSQNAYLNNPFYHYLVSLSVIVLLICLSCEYRLITLPNGWLLAASGLLFPLAMLASNLISELYGYRANLRLAAILIISQLAFDLFLMKIGSMASLNFLNFNALSYFTVLMRLPAGALALFVAFVGNAMLLENLKYTKLGIKQSLRIVIANFFSTSVLCLVNYSLLYSGVYPYEQISNLAFSSWLYKFGFIVAALPLVLWLYNYCSKFYAKENELLA